MNKNLVLSSIITITVVFGLVGYSIDFKAFGETSDEKQDKLQNQAEERQKQLEERMQQAQDNLEKQKQKIEEQREKAKKELEQKQNLKSSNVQENQKVKDELERKREIAKQKLEEKKEQLKKLKIKDQISEQIQQKQEELSEKVSDKNTDLKLKVLEKHEDLQKILEEKKSVIKEKLTEAAIEKARKNLKEKLTNLTSNNLSSISSNLDEKITAPSNDLKISKENINKLDDELKDEIEYKSDLIEAKIKEIGKDKFIELKILYQEKLKEKALEKFNEIKPDIKSKGLIAQVEDGSYFGIYGKEVDIDTINYNLSFDGKAVKSGDPSNVKFVSGDIFLELVSLNELNAKLRVIGGNFKVMDSDDGLESNQWDASFGRARVLLDSDSMQITVNAVDQNNVYATFRMQSDTEGIFPVSYGDAPLGIDASEGRTSISGKWILDITGSLSVSEPIPLNEFNDVKDTVQLNIISNSISKDVTNEMINDFNKSIFEILTSDEFSGLTENEIKQIQKELESEFLSEIEQDISNVLQEKVKMPNQGTSE